MFADGEVNSRLSRGEQNFGTNDVGEIQIQFHLVIEDASANGSS